MAKILILGSTGRLGAALMREYRETHALAGLSHAQIDLADLDEIEQMLLPRQFDVLINCAAQTNVDVCEEQPDDAFRINGDAPGLLAEICRDKDAKMIHFSTDYVFDGEKSEPYKEDDETRPISIYGESKREGEKSVMDTDDRHLVVRVSWVFGPDRPSFIDAIIQRARQNGEVAAIADKFSTPTYTLDIAKMLARFIEDGPEVEDGLLHFASSGQCSWQEYAQQGLDCCAKLGVPLKAETVGPLELASMKSFIASRPAYTVLSTARYTQLVGEPPRDWRDALAEYVQTHIARSGV